MSGRALPKLRDHGREFLVDHQHLRAAVGQDVELLGHREPPVQRHQHRAEPRAGIEQHQIVAMIGGEDRNAVAAPDAEFGFQRAGGVDDARMQARHS